MDRREWDQTYTEMNAKAEMWGAGIAVGCVGIPLFLFLLLIVGVALFGGE